MIQTRGVRTESPGRNGLFGFRRRRASGLVSAVLRFVPGAGVLLGLGGCQPPLLTADEPRSQFHQYDVVRDEQTQPFVRDEFGRQIPNLRGRLLRPD